MNTEPKSRAAWFWGGFVAVLLVGLILALFAGLRSAQRWAEAGLEQSSSVPRELKTAIAVTLSGGGSLYVAPESVPLIKGDMSKWIAGRRAEL